VPQRARAEAHRFGYWQLSEKQIPAVACAVMAHVSSTAIGQSWRILEVLSASPLAGFPIQS
jgi:hypothetical protein